MATNFIWQTHYTLIELAFRRWRLLVYRLVAFAAIVLALISLIIFVLLAAPPLITHGQWTVRDSAGRLCLVSVGAGAHLVSAVAGENRESGSGRLLERRGLARAGAGFSLRSPASSSVG